MGKYSEETLCNYCSAVSDTEQTRIENAKSMIKSAINDSSELQRLEYEIFEQGSYANNTNIKADSDIDICIMLTSAIFCGYPDGKTDSDYGYTSGTITYDDYKQRVIRALNKKFGNDVTIVNKSVKIRSNSYRVNADVVIAFQYRDYKRLNSSRKNIYTEGIKFIARNNDIIINYPKEHIKNGISKNKLTDLKYKKLVRIFKTIKGDITNDDKISSFLIEALIWNTPNRIFNYTNYWSEITKEAVRWLYWEINNNKCGNWREVSECLYLFDSNRKWTQEHAKDFLLKMWHHMEYK
jgi:hypothetical protein